MVSSLNLSDGIWDGDHLACLFDQDSVKNIKEMLWVKSDQKGKLIWVRTKSGIFSVKLVYQLEMGGEERGKSWWKYL